MIRAISGERQRVGRTAAVTWTT